MLSDIELEKIKGLLREFTAERKCRLHVILIGGLAVQYYGIQDRATIDIDAEVREDIEDARFVARKFNVSAEDIKKSSEDTIQHSIIDTAIFIFRKNVEIFISKLP